jgi:N6-L-threonylcarbamoyladenine synthase
MCTDNAAMIASAGWYRLQSSGSTSLSAGALPNLKLTDTAN